MFVACVEVCLLCYSFRISPYYT